METIATELKDAQITSQLQQSKPKRKFKITLNEYKLLLDDLVKLYPNCFSARAPKPLKIGIRQDLQNSLKEKNYTLGSNKINGFLRLYCTRKEYILSHRAGKLRVDLNGNRVGEVTLEQAQEMLKLLPIPKPKAKKKSTKNVDKLEDKV